MARILEAPESYEVIPRELLEALAAMLREPEGVSRPTHNAGGAAFDPVAYCQAHNILVHHTKYRATDRAGAKCTVAVLERCIQSGIITRARLSSAGPMACGHIVAGIIAA